MRFFPTRRYLTKAMLILTIIPKTEIDKEVTTIWLWLEFFFELVALDLNRTLPSLHFYFHFD